ncbi:Hypp6753 [Branchiostoma lanceolatum]|uniref:Hypp6753 protein n=1 Tax=Branchiostoma lanceolatum TaxID=7740 RepID=A0A8J9YVF5_BRALA|nr:Hypp6753 [Branchiostoma lanceolatum]
MGKHHQAKPQYLIRKTHIRRYVNEKHDVISAEDMKEAMESHGGVKGCRVAVAQLAPGKETPGRLEGVKVWKNFTFDESVICETLNQPKARRARGLAKAEAEATRTIIQKRATVLRCRILRWWNRNRPTLARNRPKKRIMATDQPKVAAPYNQQPTPCAWWHPTYDYTSLPEEPRNLRGR